MTVDIDRMHAASVERARARVAAERRYIANNSWYASRSALSAAERSLRLLEGK